MKREVNPNVRKVGVFVKGFFNGMMIVCCIAMLYLVGYLAYTIGLYIYTHNGTYGGVDLLGFIVLCIGIIFGIIEVYREK